MGLVYIREIDEKTKFAIWKIEETSDQLLSQLQLDGREREKLASLNKGKRTSHWLATRVLLRHLLRTSDYISCPSDEHGKPYLPDHPYKISLTHSFDYAGIMMSTQGECGIDLERIADKIRRIQHKFMKPEELAFIPEEGGLKHVEQLYACWCAKEAVYKLQGKKGVSFFRDMHILPFEYQPQGHMTLILDHENKTSTFKVYYEKFEAYMLGYAVADAISVAE